MVQSGEPVQEKCVPKVGPPDTPVSHTRPGGRTRTETTYGPPRREHPGTGVPGVERELDQLLEDLRQVDLGGDVEPETRRGTHTPGTSQSVPGESRASTSLTSLPVTSSPGTPFPPTPRTEPVRRVGWGPRGHSLLGPLVHLLADCEESRAAGRAADGVSDETRRCERRRLDLLHSECPGS